MTEQSPLIEIRAAELAAARTVAAAGEEAERRISVARREAVQMVDEARERGRAIAHDRHQAALEAADEQAGQIAQFVAGRIEGLRRDVTPEIDRLVDAMLGVVLPRPE